MEILILLLVSPGIFAQQRYRKHVNPNDEPFLPIHPIYPYNPKLTKRGSDRDLVTFFKPELYAPRPESRDTFTGSFAGSSKDSFFPGYNSHPRSPPTSQYSHHYGNSLFAGYPGPYTSGPPTSGPYPEYYPQPSFFYPEYYNQGFPYSFPGNDNLGPPGPPGPPIRSEITGDYYPTEKPEKPRPAKPRMKESGRFVDGDNLISQSYKDLAPHSESSYNKIPADQLTGNYHPLLQPTYKVISVGGRPVGPNYPIPVGYARAQLMEQVAAVQSLAKSLGPAFSEQFVTPSHASFSQQGALPKPDNIQDDLQVYSQDQIPSSKMREGQLFYPNAQPGKPAKMQAYGSEVEDMPAKDSNGQFLAQDEQNSRKLNDALRAYGEPQDADDKSTGQSNKELENFHRSSDVLARTPAKFQTLQYKNVAQMPATQVTFERSQSAYISPGQPEITGEPFVRSYNQTPSTNGISYRIKDGVPFRAQNGGGYAARPQAYTYHLMNGGPFSREPQQQAKTNLEDVNFGTKQGIQG